MHNEQQTTQFSPPPYSKKFTGYRIMAEQPVYCFYWPEKMHWLAGTA